ncbi:chromate efflux transporter subunit ChrB [Bacillaceae bacterium]
MKVYWELTVAFARSGILGYGGGPSVIPLIRFEAVQKFKWMEDEEFAEILAMANTLPGPIATKMAAYIGYKVKGTNGALVAILAHILPTVFAMIGLLSFLYALRNSPVVKGMIQAVTPVIGVMLAVMAYEFLQKAKKGMGLKWTAISLLVCLLALEAWDIHPGFVIAVFLGTAFVLSTYKKRNLSSSKLSVRKEKKV